MDKTACKTKKAEKKSQRCKALQMPLLVYHAAHPTIDAHCFSENLPTCIFLQLFKVCSIHAAVFNDLQCHPIDSKHLDRF